MRTNIQKNVLYSFRQNWNKFVLKLLQNDLRKSRWVSTLSSHRVLFRSEAWLWNAKRCNNFQQNKECELTAQNDVLSHFLRRPPNKHHLNWKVYPLYFLFRKSVCLLFRPCYIEFASLWYITNIWDISKSFLSIFPAQYLHSSWSETNHGFQLSVTGLTIDINRDFVFHHVRIINTVMAYKQFLMPIPMHCLSFLLNSKLWYLILGHISVESNQTQEPKVIKKSSHRQNNYLCPWPSFPSTS